MYLKEILKHLKYELLFGESNRKVAGVTCNSKECGKDYVFVAIKGFNNDGHDFIPHAIEQGATVIIYEAFRGLDISDYSGKGLTFIKVLDGRYCFSKICSVFNGFPSKNCNLIGITGTNGKTSVTYILESVLENCGVIGTINYRYGKDVEAAENTTPDSCKINETIKNFIEKGAKYIAMEVSSHGIDLHRVDNLDFNTAVFTNLTPEHLDYHKNMEDYFQAKLRFFTDILPSSCKEHVGAVINIDDLFGMRISEKINDKLNVVTYSLSNNSADIYYEKFQTKLKGTKAKINFFGKSYEIKTDLVGKFNLMNIAAALGALKFSDVNIEEVILKLNEKLIIPGRLEKVVKNRNIFVDYAHTEDALKNVLTCLNEIKDKNSRIITVFGCGGDRDKSKRKRMGEVAARLSDFVVVTSDNPRNENPLDIISEIVSGVTSVCKGDKYRIIPDRRDAIKMSIKLAGANDIVVIAGKGHEDYQIVRNKKIHFSDREVVKEFLKTGDE